MKTVKIYIETTITGPAAPKRGGYAAALTFTRRNGDIEDRFLKGEEEGTTYNRSVLLAMIYALQKLKEPCRVVFYTRNTYIKNMILADNPEKWRRAEWKKSDGKGIQNQDLWKMFLEESTEDRVPGKRTLLESAERYDRLYRLSGISDTILWTIGHERGKH